MDIILGRYRHYKGKHYQVLDVVVHSETLEKLILYKSEVGSEEFSKDTLWVRPYHLFVETINLDGKKVKRFTKVDD